MNQSSNAVTRENVAEIFAAYKALPVKGEGFIKSATNMVALKPLIEIGNTSKLKVGESIVGPGVTTVPCTHPAFGEVVAAIQKIDNEAIQLPALQKLSKSEIRISETTPDGTQGHIAVLMLHGLISLD